MNLLKQLQELREKRNAEMLKITNAATNEALDAIELEIRKYDMQITQLEGLIKDGGEGEDPAARKSDESGENPENRNLNPLATFENRRSANAGSEEDIYGSMEYRNAFKNYVVSGTPIPEKFHAENRAAELTVVGDVAAVIPTTISNKVIEDLTTEGKIISRITQTSFQGGIQIPISEINPTATWLESESVVSEEQKAKMEAKLQFAYHVLEARVAVGLLTSTVSLPVFEATIVKNLKKAMYKAIEMAAVAGTGSGQPLGFTKHELPANQKISFDDTNISTVKGWARVEAALTEAYEDGEIYVMNKQTWEMYLNSMTDTTGQKIGLGRINEKGQRILNGREVLCSDTIPSYDSVAAEGVFGVLVNLSEYCLNSNLAMYYKKYFDEDKNKWVHKSLMIADGKMPIGKDSKNNLVGAKGLIYMVKAAAGE
ncbi:phage major capsid protein [Lachnoclostridium phytofermentans]|uniref:phage major capsid protein n=1 Tax=Lachnoclostridium phytofermentans TaxID=66219 RepID=UPI000495066D|nr:phage major capsid protein [Lachnoclostridium phytofermentans]